MSKAPSVWKPIHPLEDRPMGKRIAKDLWARHSHKLRQMSATAVDRFVENETSGETENVTWWTKDALAQLCRDNARLAVAPDKRVL